jgi:hypothetical protein
MRLIWTWAHMRSDNLRDEMNGYEIDGIRGWADWMRSGKMSRY